VPILALPPGRKRRPGHAGAVVVGRGRFRIDRDLLLLDGQIADVEVRVPPGRYPCGLDLWLSDTDMEQRGDVLVFHSWVPASVTLHLNGGTERADGFAGLDRVGGERVVSTTAADPGGPTGRRSPAGRPARPTVGRPGSGRAKVRPGKKERVGVRFWPANSDRARAAYLNTRAQTGFPSFSDSSRPR
jgi:hypothetical protein